MERCRNNNEKIALVAPYKDANYGTLLQAYSLAKKVKEFGCECEYISFVPIYKHNLLERIVIKIRKCLGLYKKEDKQHVGIDDYSFFSSKEFASLKDKTNVFVEKNIPHTITYNPKTIKRSPRYRKYIVGSDQTWSLERYDKYAFYFLKFVNHRCKKYSYAPSLGTTCLSEKHKTVLKMFLPTFDRLSCREKSNSSVLSSMIGKKVNYAIDPTLLLNREFWMGFSKPISLPEQYILAYILGEKECIVEFAERLGERRGIPVFYVVTRPKYLKMLNRLEALSPEEWVYAVNNASCIVTDSFHGSLFSINLNRDFYTFTKRSRERNDFNDNDRIAEVLSTFDLMSRFVEDDKVDIVLQNDCPVDYDDVNRLITEQRKDSLDYLCSILND